ncbi:MAG: CvpA family protein [Gammaproteobacteria bacterium]|nr:CvpA family protein [Gammaproteobacteria bacterium]
MITLDFVIIAAIIVSVMVGFVRGFIPEIIAMATWVAAIWIGWKFPYFVEPYISGKLGSVTIELWVSRCVVFLIVLILGNVLSQFVTLTLDKARFGAIDHSLGMVFGFIRAMVVFALLVSLGQTINLPEEDWWQESAMMPYGERVTGWLKGVLPPDLTQKFTVWADE